MWDAHIRSIGVGKEVSGFYEELCGLENEVKRLTEFGWDTEELEFVKEKRTANSIKGFREIHVCNIRTSFSVEPAKCDFMQK